MIRDTECKKMPYLKLTGLSFAAFLAIMTETVPSGLLIFMSDSFETSTGVVGQFLTAYAVGSVVAAIPVMAATRNIPRRPLLVSAVLSLAIFNMATAVTDILAMAFIFRFASGMAGGVVWGLVANYARSIVPVDRQGRALAIVGFGQPIALAFGVPLGAWAGSVIGWRGVFFTLSGVAIILAAWIWVTIPPRPGVNGDAPGGRLLKKVLLIYGVPVILFSLLGWVCSHNIIYTYIAPFVVSSGAGISIDIVLLSFGIAAGIGIFITATVVDDRLLLTAWGCGILYLSGLVVLSLFSHTAIGFLLGVVLWGLGFGGAPTVLQTSLALRSHNYADISQSFFVTIFNIGVALGGFLGGIWLGRLSSTGLPWLATVIFFSVLIVIAFNPRVFRGKISVNG